MTDFLTTLVELLLGLAAAFGVAAALFALLHWRDQLRIDREARRVEHIRLIAGTAHAHVISPGYMIIAVAEIDGVKLYPYGGPILPSASTAPIESPDPSYEAMRRKAMTLLTLSGKKHPNDPERIASQDEAEDNGIPSTTHHLIVTWLAPYGVKTSNTGTYCDAPFPTRDKLYTALLMKTPLPQPNGEVIPSKS